MKKYTGYLIDLDGTIYQGNNKVDGAKEFIERLKIHNIDYLFLTNNSTKTAPMVAEFLTQVHGIPTLPNQVYTSAMATADYLINTLKLTKGSRVYVIGEIGLKSALSNAGFQLTAKEPEVVIVGLDTQVNYQMFEDATLAIRRGAKYIATNLDTNIPNERGLIPGAGALNALIITATNVQPIEIGKPSSQIIELAMQRLVSSSEQTLIVGDNYATDILAGINAHVDTLLTYTGISTKSQVAKQTKKPTYEVDSLNDWYI